jgi:hypothetical protein
MPSEPAGRYGRVLRGSLPAQPRQFWNDRASRFSECLERKTRAPANALPVAHIDRASKATDVFAWDDIMPPGHCGEPLRLRAQTVRKLVIRGLTMRLRSRASNCPNRSSRLVFGVPEPGHSFISVPIFFGLTAQVIPHRSGLRVFCFPGSSRTAQVPPIKHPLALGAAASRF